MDVEAVQKCSDARRAKNEPRGVYRYTLSGAVCSATQQMSVFQQPFFIKLTLPPTHANHAFPAMSDGKVLSLIPQLGILRLLP